MRVDSIYENASVITGAGSTHALAVLHGRIVALGDDAADLSARRRVDLAGATVVPGFHDAHNHMAWFGIGLDDVPLGSEHCARVDDVYDAIAGRAKEQPAGTRRGTVSIARPPATTCG